MAIQMAIRTATQMAMSVARLILGGTPFLGQHHEASGPWAPPGTQAKEVKGAKTGGATAQPKEKGTQTKGRKGEKKGRLPKAALRCVKEQRKAAAHKSWPAHEDRPQCWLMRPLAARSHHGWLVPVAPGATKRPGNRAQGCHGLFRTRGWLLPVAPGVTDPTRQSSIKKPTDGSCRLRLASQNRPGRRALG